MITDKHYLQLRSN